MCSFLDLVYMWSDESARVYATKPHLWEPSQHLWHPVYYHPTISAQCRSQCNSTCWSAAHVCVWVASNICVCSSCFQQVTYELTGESMAGAVRKLFRNTFAYWMYSSKCYIYSTLCCDSQFCSTLFLTLDSSKYAILPLEGKSVYMYIPGLASRL